MESSHQQAVTLARQGEFGAREQSRRKGWARNDQHAPDHASGVTLMARERSALRATPSTRFARNPNSPPTTTDEKADKKQ